MRCRSILLVALGTVSLACARGKDAPPSEPPAAEAEAPQDEAVEVPTPSAEDDPLADLGGDETPERASRPPPFDVTVDAVMTAPTEGAKVLMVGADPRFTFHVKIETIEPETPELEPTHYNVMIHSPTQTFRGRMPDEGKPVRFMLTVHPESPDDPHDETFFSALWVP